MRLRQKISVWLLMVVAFLCMPSAGVLAQTSTSPNYGVTQVQFGSGGGNASSGSYQAQTTVGTNGVGIGSGTLFRSAAGYITPNEPYLLLIVSSSTINLGTLTNSTTGTGTGTFSVKTYLSSSYAVYTMSPPPTNESGNPLAPMSAGGASSAGTEQFGINLVANTVPTSFGAVPVNIPDNTFADGKAAAGYSTPNSYKYNQGDMIAQSPNTAGNQAIGETDYTISYIANIGTLTKEGLYTMNHVLVAVATY